MSSTRDTSGGVTWRSLRGGLVLFAGLALGLTVQGAFAGSLDSPAAPTAAASAMYRIEDVYNRLDAGEPGAKRTGVFEEPTAGPAATGHSLDEVMAKAPAADNSNGAAPADVRAGKTYWGLRTDGAWGPQAGTANIAAYPGEVPKTGQTTSSATGDDGDMRKGMACPYPRFADNNNGTVTDNLTGLIWLKNANAFGAQAWADALTNCATLNSGEAGLTDGSVQGDWRLPNVRELHSLIDYGCSNPALTAGHPFAGVQSTNYWSSSTHAATGSGWAVNLYVGGVPSNAKTYTYYVWPVRGGQ